VALDYTLAVLTHGPGRTIYQVLASFQDKVTPRPSRIAVHCDGPRQAPVRALDLLAEQSFDSEQRGFCRATGRLWKWASDGETEFVFWLEHDFVFLRPVDLEPLAATLRADPTVAQMQLMRTPVAQAEIAAGGLFEMRRDDYTPRMWVPEPPITNVPGDVCIWQSHRSYFTTNPSLMRSEFMALNPWPDDDAGQCEGRFSIDLVKRGFSFGVWGSGEPWVQHIGRRDGSGGGY
jgi:hypothetical protein